MELNNIKSPADIKSMTTEQLSTLAGDMRAALIKKLSLRGGHVGPNLGFLESTIALHYVFNSPTDKLVFDVSHQCYAHKMLTGRMQAFTDEAHYGDVSGYTNPGESEHDHFMVGHTSTSVSLASGLAKARDFKGEKYNVIAIIGDGSLSGGEALEGLDVGATLDSNFIVLVNDNQMSIAENHGGLYENLKELRESNGTCPVNLFKALGYDYIYVPYGNDLASLIAAFEKVKDIDHPVVVHVNTMKGEGLAPAEQNKERFHYSAPFDPATGALRSTSSAENYADIFATHMLARMKQDKTVCTLTAGTPAVLGFYPERRAEAGRQFIDVGIAEEHAVAMASGLAANGCKPVFGVASSFIQRTYDQLSQDLALNGNAATIVTFFTGAMALNDATHLGFFSSSMIAGIPGITLLAPTCRGEFLAMLDWAIDQNGAPVVIAAPSAVIDREGDFNIDYSHPTYETVVDGDRVAIIAAGDFLSLGLEAAEVLKQRGINAKVINPRTLNILDTDILDALRDFEHVITLEDSCVDGGMGQKIAAYLGEAPVKVTVKGLPREFADRYNPADLLKANGLTAEAIADIVK